MHMISTHTYKVNSIIAWWAFSTERETVLAAPVGPGVTAW